MYEIIGKITEIFGNIISDSLHDNDKICGFVQFSGSVTVDIHVQNYIY
jgi:hypothetical protein